MTLTLVAFACLLALCFARVPIAFAMGIVGFVGFAVVRGLDAAPSQLAQTAFATGINYELSVLPLFILMGNFVTNARLSEDLYKAANAFLGHRRGGLAMATVVACGGFASVCGSSMATAATMAKVAMPSMRRFGYADGLAAGSIASGGTLGILIPPSTIMVIYGIMTQTNIGKLFAAGILPGIVGVTFYLLAVQYVVRKNPKAGPPGQRQPYAQRFRTLLDVWGVILLFLLVMVGIYGGIFTPTEAAGIGASGAFLFALFRRELTWKKLLDVLVESAVTTAMLFMVLIGATLFSDLINQTGFSEALVSFVDGLNVNRWGVLVAIILIYIVLGCVLESLSMILLTVPVFFPLVMSLGFDTALGYPKELIQIWFGILVVVVVEISLLTPPVGLNVFVIRSVLPDVPTGTIFKGVMPFFFMDIFRIAVIAALPIISIWLPSHMR
ncbi:MAG: TRAP transporter large permease [Rhodospirillaceae bacterium]|nr:TRAP transporter large permease [Rhodospirillaceae bacterium]